MNMQWRLWLVLPLATCVGGLAAGQSTTRVSVNSAGVQGNSDSSSWGGGISDDGRFAAFWSAASNLVPGDTNGRDDVFVHDRLGGLTTRVSVDSSGVQGNGRSLMAQMSADGRYIAFISEASNLVPGDTSGGSDVFVHDRLTGLTERVSVDSAGAQSGGSAFCCISADGRYVAFMSGTSNLVPGDTNGVDDAFVHDRLSGVTERVSVDSSGIQGNSHSAPGSISADGRHVTFLSAADNLVPGDTNWAGDVFVRDRLSGTTSRMSVSTGGAQGNNTCSNGQSISADGRYVAFSSIASNLVSGDTNIADDIFVHDRQLGITSRVSVSSSGVQGDYRSFRPSFSADARYVAFESLSGNLAPGDPDGQADVFVHDRLSGVTTLASVNSAGLHGNWASFNPSISPDGRYVEFTSLASDLVAGDTNGVADVFVRDRGAPSPGTDLCRPGTGGVLACPCLNPPASAPRGCNNSSNTGGAQLTSSGTASISSDTLVFVTNGQKPSAPSLVFQGTAEITAGLAFGQGVRCVGGALTRLYVKTASGGSITAPQAGDLSVSAGSAAAGDAIAPGTSRWYAVYYRDPTVLGGCSAASTFNVTQTQVVTWGL